MAKKGTHVHRFRLGEVVDIVLQNTRALSGAEEIHPWHLHLHNFWVLGYGDHYSTWTPADSIGYDTITPVPRNMAILYPQSWTVLRFRADNPGIAFFHCHIAAHLEMGMALSFQVGEASQFPPPSVDLDSACGVRKKSPVRVGEKKRKFRFHSRNRKSLYAKIRRNIYGAKNKYARRPGKFTFKFRIRNAKATRRKLRRRH